MGLPDYAALLLAFHEEFAPELRAMVSRLPMEPQSRVLDVACGDGRFSAWLAERVVRPELVTAVDASPAWLQMAERTLRESGAKGVQLRRADARRLPFADETFDLVWCAQSLYSLPEVRRCLAEMVRVLRKGGTLAILEDDTLHHILLPWPIDLELEVRGAELAAFRAEAVGTTRSVVAPARYYVARWTSRLLRKAGLNRIREHSTAATRQSPLSPAAKRFFGEYLANLARRVGPLLTCEAKRRLERLTEKTSRRYLLRQRDFTAVCLDRVVSGVRGRGMPTEAAGKRAIGPKHGD